MINFVLNESEVRQALLLTGQIKPVGKKSIVQAVLCGVLAAIFAVDIALNPAQSRYYILLAVCLILIPVVLILPKKTQAAIVAAHTDGAELCVRVEDSKITVDVSGENIPPHTWFVTAEDTEKVLESEEIIVFILKDKRALPLPKRAMNDNQLAEFQKTAENFVK